MHGRYSVLSHYLKVSLKNSRFLKIPKLHPQMVGFYLLVDLIGFEPTTPTMRMWCAPSCATSREKSILFHCPLDGKQFSICVDTLCYMWYLS